jgi:CDP-paratose 2-epimerase
VRILITGGLGFIGSTLAQALLREGHDVTVADNLIRRGSELNLERLRDCFVYCDVRNEDDVALLPPLDLVITCHAEMVTTGQKGYEHPGLPIRNNGFSQLNMLEYCRRHGSRILHISTNRVYNLSPLDDYTVIEHPTRLELQGFEGICRGAFGTDGGEKGIYGVSKLVADALVQEYHSAFGVPSIVNRIGSITGPGQFGCAEQGWASYFVRSYAERKPLTFVGYGGKQVRDLLHVADLARLICAQVARDAFEGQVIDVGGGISRALSLLEAKVLLDELFGYTVPVYEQPIKKADPPVTFMNNQAVEAAYGFVPQVSLRAMFAELRELVLQSPPGG